MTSSRIAVAFAAVLVACAGSRPEQRTDRSSTSAQAMQPAPSRSDKMARMADVCPMDVPDTKVAASDTAQGEALTFTTSSGQVDELRRRVRAMADMHNQHMGRAAAAQSGTGNLGGTGTGADQERQHLEGHHGMMPGSKASVEDVDNGVRVNIVPEDPAQADQLRSMVRMHAERMQSEGCAMMHHG